MSIPLEQKEALLRLYPNAQEATEGGIIYFLIQQFVLPDGCTPQVVDALLCPSVRDGYNSRLFFAEQINSPIQRNWNGQNVRILGRNWFAISWQTPPGFTLEQMILTHLNSLING